MVCDTSYSGQQSPGHFYNFLQIPTDLTLAPLELAAEHFEERAPGVQKPHLILGFPAINMVAIIDRHPRLAIDAEIGFFIAGHDYDLNVRSVAHDQRAMGQGVG